MSAHRKTTRSRPRAAITIVLLAVFLFSLQQALLNTVLPTLQREYGTTQSGSSWVITAFLISASVFTPIIGRLGDRYGKDRLLALSLAALAIGSLVAAVAPNIEMLILGRVLQGVGGGVQPLAFGIIRDEAPPARIGPTIGGAAALIAVGAGAGAGTVIAGPLSAALGFRSLFWLPMLLTAIVTAAVHLAVPPSPSRRPGPISWLAAVLMAGWLVALLLPMAQGAAWGWSSGKVIGLLIAAAVLAPAWAMVEHRSTTPLIDLRMMRIPAIWTTNLVSLLTGVGLFAVTAFLPGFVQAPPESGYGFGATITQARLLLLPMTVMMSLVGLVSARLNSLVGARATLIGSTALNVASLALLTFAHEHLWQLLLATTLLGAAFGSAFATMATVIVDTVSPDQTGVANGVNANVRTIGGAAGTALMGGILSASIGLGDLPSEDGYSLGFGALGIAGVIALGAALAVPRRTTPKPATVPRAPAEGVRTPR